MSKYGRIFSKIISQNLEDTPVGYILQNYTYLNFGRIHFGLKKLGDGGNLLGDGADLLRDGDDLLRGGFKNPSHGNCP